MVRCTLTPVELLTATEMARRLGIPESTARFYARRFSAFLPTVGEGRSRRYQPEALDVLRIVADAVHAGMPTAQIHQALTERFALTVEPQQQLATTQQQSVTTQDPVIVAELRAVVTDLRSELADVLTELRSLADRYGQQEQQLAALRSELVLLRTVADERRHQSWWRRAWDAIVNAP